MPCSTRATCSTPTARAPARTTARWQFGVLGPPGARRPGLGEDPALHLECLLDATGTTDGSAHLVVHLRFLQLQHRRVLDGSGGEVSSCTVGAVTWLTWDEAVEQEVSFTLALTSWPGADPAVAVGGDVEIEQLVDDRGAAAGAVVRRRWPLSAVAQAAHRAGRRRAQARSSTSRTSAGPRDDQGRRDAALAPRHPRPRRGPRRRRSCRCSTRPRPRRAAAADCDQHRCWPVLAGLPGDTDLLLGPADHPLRLPRDRAARAPGALFDATEIDEILTLRVLTMTDAEKAEARATDPLARRDHRPLRRDVAGDAPAAARRARRRRRLGPTARSPTSRAIRRDADVPWWDPATDAAVRPDD